MDNAMLTPLPTVPPAMVAGDSLRVAFADIARAYPAADGYSVAVIFAPIAGGVPVEFACTGGASDWLLLVPAATSAAWAAGDRRWLARVGKAGDVATVAQGQVMVIANPAIAGADARSHARRVLDAIEAVIEKRASATDLKTVFEDGRSIDRLSHAELLTMRDSYAAKVRSEMRRASGRGPARVLVQL